jgi:hypothetical protein
VVRRLEQLRDRTSEERGRRFELRPQPFQDNSIELPSREPFEQIPEPAWLIVEAAEHHVAHSRARKLHGAMQHLRREHGVYHHRQRGMPLHERRYLIDSKLPIGAWINYHDVDGTYSHRVGERAPIIEDD